MAETDKRKDWASVVLDAIQERGSLAKAKIVEVLVGAGLADKAAERTWATLQPFIKEHPRIRMVRRRTFEYEWSAETVTPDEALNRMRAVHKQRTPGWLLDALAEVVRASLGGGDSGRVAQERQWRIDVARAVAELAMSVEEITYKGADVDGVLERVRNGALAHSLLPIGQSGEEAKFDPALHVPLAGSPDVGSSVLIIRPGYSWRTDIEDLLIERAVVRTM